MRGNLQHLHLDISCPRLTLMIPSSGWLVHNNNLVEDRKCLPRDRHRPVRALASAVPGLAMRARGERKNAMGSSPALCVPDETRRRNVISRICLPTYSESPRAAAAAAASVAGHLARQCRPPRLQGTRSGSARICSIRGSLTLRSRSC